MPIKKSILEQKWYYRVVKIIYILLPFGVGAYFYLTKKITATNLSKHGLIWAAIVFGYYVGISLLWRIVLYIGFGGLEDDIKKKVEKPGVLPGTTGPIPIPAKKAGGGLAAFIVIIMIIGMVAFFSSITNLNSNNSHYDNSTTTNSHTVNTNQYVKPINKNVAPKCVPTGCGNLWYCSGYYYVDNVRISVPGGCFPNGARPGDIYGGWSGKCRQCP